MMDAPVCPACGTVAFWSIGEPRQRMHCVHECTDDERWWSMWIAEWRQIAWARDDQERRLSYAQARAAEGARMLGTQ